MCCDCDLPPDIPPESKGFLKPWTDAQTFSSSSSTHQLSFCTGQGTFQGKNIMGHWEEMGKASLIIGMYGVVLERPADPTGKQDTADHFLELLSFNF